MEGVGDVGQQVLVVAGEERSAHPRLEDRSGQRLEPGVHQLDGGRLVVVAVAVAVDPVRTGLDPRAQRPDGGGLLGVGGRADDLQHPGQHLVAAQVGGRGVLGGVDDVGQHQLAVLGLQPRVEAVAEQLRAPQWRVLRAAAAVVGLLVVPADQRRLVDGLRALGHRLVAGQVRVRIEALPLGLGRPADRQQPVDARRPDRVGAGVDVADVLVVGVEPVEGVADLHRRALEALHVVDLLRVVPVLEPGSGIQLVQVGGALAGVDHGNALDRRPGDDEADLRAQHAERRRPGGGLVGQARGPALRALERLHRLTAAAVLVGHRVDRRLRAVGVAEVQRVDVGDVLAGRGRAPRVVLAAPDLHVGPGAGDVGPADVEAGAVGLDAPPDLGLEVGGLGAEDGQRVARGRMLGRDEQRVGVAGREAHQAGIGTGRALHRRGVGLAHLRGDELQRARVRQRDAALDRAPGDLAVGEALGPGGRHRRLGIVLAAEVLPDLHPAARPEALDVGHQPLELVDLVPAAVAQLRADQRRGVDDVGRCPRVGALGAPDGRVLDRHQRGIELGLSDVGVDAVAPRLHVGDEVDAVGAIELGHLVELVLQVGRRVRRGVPLPVVGLDVGAAGERGEIGVAVVAQHVHEEQPVLGLGVADPEGGRRTRVAVDVGDAEALVADDRDVRAPAGVVGARDVAGLDPEVRLGEVLADVGVLEPRRGVEQVGVEVALVGEVVGGGAVGLVLPGLQGVGHAGLAGGDDVEEAPVGTARVIGRRCRRGGRGGGQRQGQYGADQGGGPRQLEHWREPTAPCAPRTPVR